MAKAEATARVTEEEKSFCSTKRIFHLRTRDKRYEGDASFALSVVAALILLRETVPGIRFAE